MKTSFDPELLNRVLMDLYVVNDKTTKNSFNKLFISQALAFINAFLNIFKDIEAENLREVMNRGKFDKKNLQQIVKLLIMHLLITFSQNTGNLKALELKGSSFESLVEDMSKVIDFHKEDHKTLVDMLAFKYQGDASKYFSKVYELISTTLLGERDMNPYNGVAFIQTFSLMYTERFIPILKEELT